MNAATKVSNSQCVWREKTFTRMTFVRLPGHKVNLCVFTANSQRVLFVIWCCKNGDQTDLGCYVWKCLVTLNYWLKHTHIKKPCVSMKGPEQNMWVRWPKKGCAVASLWNIVILSFFLSFFLSSITTIDFKTFTHLSFAGDFRFLVTKKRIQIGKALLCTAHLKQWSSRGLPN